MLSGSGSRPGLLRDVFRFVRPGEATVVHFHQTTRARRCGAASRGSRGSDRGGRRPRVRSTTGVTRVRARYPRQRPVAQGAHLSNDRRARRRAPVPPRRRGDGQRQAPRGSRRRETRHRGGREARLAALEAANTPTPPAHHRGLHLGLSPPPLSSAGGLYYRVSDRPTDPIESRASDRTPRVAFAFVDCDVDYTAGRRNRRARSPPSRPTRALPGRRRRDPLHPPAVG